MGLVPDPLPPLMRRFVLRRQSLTQARERGLRSQVRCRLRSRSASDEFPFYAGGSAASPWSSESNRATGNAFYLSPSPTARNHWESGPSGARTNEHNSEQAPLGSTAARPAPEPACDATKHLQM
jgi:hypothetical protein